MEDQDFKYCKICLVTDVAMSSSPSIRKAYSQIAQVILREDYQLYVCYECVYLLNKYQGFRFKCLTALNVLSSFNVDHSKITKETIESIDRKHYRLETKLAYGSMLICNSDDQEVLPKCCYDADVKLEDGLGSDFTFEPEIELKIDARVPINHTQTQDVDFSNEIILESNDYVSDYNNIVPEVKMNTKCLPKLKNKKENATKAKKSLKPKEKKQNLTKSKKRDSTLDTLMKKLNEQPKGVGKQKSSQWLDKVKEYATVVLLTPKDARKEMLMRRESLNYKNNPHKCDLCYKGFGLKSTLDNHMKLHSPELGNVDCEYCHKRFRNGDQLYKHVTRCHKYKICCKVCPYVCRYLGQAVTHVSLHKGEKYPCEICGTIFRFAHTLINHKRIKHSDCACELCGSMFVSQKGLHAHKTMSHKQEDTELMGPKCVECDVQFATETAWKRHLVLSSRHNVQNGCEECGEAFASCEELKTHSKMHTRRFINRSFKPPGNCKRCDKWLTTYSEYNDHMRRQHPRADDVEVMKVVKKGEAEEGQIFVCEVCGMAFKKKVLLQYHRNKHTGDRPYQCNQCDKRYGHPSVLYIHKRDRHSNDALFQCDACQKKYISKSSLAIHKKKIHLGLRPFKCSFCDKAFIKRCVMNTHIEHVHYKKPWPKRDYSNRRRTPTTDKLTIELELE